jgi:hypothetical protein
MPKLERDRKVKLPKESSIDCYSTTQQLEETGFAICFASHGRREKMLKSYI